MIAKIFFGAINVDAIAASSASSSSDVDPLWISFAEGAKYCADIQALFSGSTTQGSWNYPWEAACEEVCDDDDK